MTLTVGWREGAGSRVVGLPLGSNEILGLLDGFCDELGAVLGADDIVGRSEGNTVGAKPQSTSSDEHLIHTSVSWSKNFSPSGLDDSKPPKH